VTTMDIATVHHLQPAVTVLAAAMLRAGHAHTIVGGASGSAWAAGGGGRGLVQLGNVGWGCYNFAVRANG
jgi:hypothetical protein